MSDVLAGTSLGERNVLDRGCEMRAIVAMTMSLTACLAACGPPTAAVSGDNVEQVTRRVPQLDNEHVEVWKTIILPDQPLSMHRHDNPRAIIALKGGTLTLVTEAGDERDMVWETGSAYWLEVDPEGELHGDVNKGTEPMEVIVVQLKNVGAEGR